MKVPFAVLFGSRPVEQAGDRPTITNPAELKLPRQQQLQDKPPPSYMYKVGEDQPKNLDLKLPEPILKKSEPAKPAEPTRYELKLGEPEKSPQARMPEPQKEAKPQMAEPPKQPELRPAEPAKAPELKLSEPPTAPEARQAEPARSPEQPQRYELKLGEPTKSPEVQASGAPETSGLAEKAKRLRIIEARPPEPEPGTYLILP